MRVHTLEKFPFGRIDFGRASAEAERSQSPHLLIEGFLDAHGHVERLTSGYSFLVLGYKGSGKSALAARLALVANQKNGLFVNVVTLQDFPFGDFAGILPAGSQPEAKLPTAWSWLLLIKFFDTLAKDNAVDANPNTEFFAAQEMLRGSGLLASSDLKKLAMISSRRELKFKLPVVFEGTWAKETRDADVRIPLLVDKLKTILGTLRGASRHLLVIDGLDDVLMQSSLQFDALSALIFEASQLNAFFLNSGVPLKIIVLCRTDIFDRLPGPNKNKIRQDGAVTLDWYHDPRDPDRSLLVQLANLRANLASNRIADVVEEYFPAGLRRFGWRELYSKKTFLLDHTRHTPRDFLRVLSYIGRATAGVQPTTDEVKSGLRQYSMEYFLREVRDELDGYLSPVQADAVFKVFASFGKARFTVGEFEKKAALYPELKDLTSREALGPLFECSALGNVRSANGKTRFTFRYRNRNSAIDLAQDFHIHPGLLKAVNVE